jgi:hypothetical protein
MCATLKDISHREVLNAASREANGIKMLQRTRDSYEFELELTALPKNYRINSRLVVPAQTVDATLSNQLIRQCLS